MSQPPPSDQDRSPERDQPPSWATGSQRSIWPSGDEPPAWPSASQASSWASDTRAPSRPAGDEPPAWPPAGQPPLSSPGYADGRGPQPPRYSRRFPIRALIVLGLFLAFGVVVHGITGHHKAVTTLPATASSGGLRTGLQAPAGRVGSSFKLDDGNGHDYQVTLVKVIDPARGASQSSRPDSGKRFVGLVFRIRALTGSPQSEDANNDAVLVGGNARDYPADLNRIAGYVNFDHGTISVAPGETVTGAVAFQVPDGVTVSRVQWTALSGFGSMAEWNVHG